MVKIVPPFSLRSILWNTGIVPGNSKSDGIQPFKEKVKSFVRGTMKITHQRTAYNNELLNEKLFIFLLVMNFVPLL